ncbi:MAG: queuine tRNA-ribosyltransferase family protein, partial [Muribaculaceae bacterium]|nr:queuine tRNA-ribosyltransferase family protein [Muribaculaceae bacterium]
LDDSTPGTADIDYPRKSLDLTHRWLDRGWEHFNSTKPLYGYSQSFFPIVQGCTYPELRRESARKVASLGADGNAIGGLAVGEPAEVMYEMIEVVNDILPADRPRYLMGVGTPANILEAIDRGVDMMDCVMPTRNGRNGMLFTSNGIMNMRNKKWADDFSPIQEDGPSYVDRVYSKAYLRHLFISQELLAMQIASIHNLAFYLWLVRQAREHILAGDFKTWKEEMIIRVTTRL